MDAEASRRHWLNRLVASSGGRHWETCRRRLAAVIRRLSELRTYVLPSAPRDIPVFVDAPRPDSWLDPWAGIPEEPELDPDLQTDAPDIETVAKGLAGRHPEAARRLLEELRYGPGPGPEKEPIATVQEVLRLLEQWGSQPKQPGALRTGAGFGPEAVILKDGPDEPASLEALGAAVFHTRDTYEKLGGREMKPYPDPERHVGRAPGAVKEDPDRPTGEEREAFKVFTEELPGRGFNPVPNRCEQVERKSPQILEDVRGNTYVRLNAGFGLSERVALVRILVIEAIESLDSIAQTGVGIARDDASTNLERARHVLDRLTQEVLPG